MKNMKIFGLILITIFVSSAFGVYAAVNIDQQKFKTILRKSMFQYFKGPENTNLTHDNMVDLVELYLKEKNIENVDLKIYAANHSGGSMESVINMALKSIKGVDICVNRCGNGVCEEEVCIGINCSCKETEESCQGDCKVYQDKCSPAGTRSCSGDYVTICEWDSSNRYLRWETSEFCEYGCVNGECKTTCTPQCSIGQTRCNTGNTAVEICTDSNSDGCGDWNNPYVIQCSGGCINGDCVNVTCTDTDPQNDIGVRGECVDSHGTRLYLDWCNEYGYGAEYDCYQGNCMPASMVCPSGYRCSNNVCVPTTCTPNWYPCAEGFYCPGNVINASDTDRCCSVPCLQPSWPDCSQCGDGPFNFCDEAECNAISQGCYFVDNILANDCIPCSDVPCSQFNDETSCYYNRCERGCWWVSNTSICLECYGCDIGTTRCIEGVYKQVCGNTDRDICGEWLEPTFCEHGCENGECVVPTCIDTDGGNYYVKGVVNIVSFKFEDRCEPDGLLKEYFCQSTEEEGFERYNCPNGCQDGKCVGETIIAGGDYYVDKNLVNDCQGTYSITSRDCSGSGGTAYNTIKEAANVAVAGDVVLVRAGIYHETLTPTNSGDSGNLIVFKAYPGEKPVIDGEYVRKTVDLSGKNYIRVEGFEIRYSTLNGVYFKDSSGIEIINNNIHHNDNVDPAVNNYEGHSGIEMSGNINNILIKGNDIHNNYWNGITPFSLSVSNLNIINNDIHNNGNDGIQQGGGSNWLIEGNKIRDQGGMPTAHPDGFQIFRPLNGLIIRRNTFYDHSQNIYMSGPLSDGFIENVEISYNIFYHDDDPYAWPRATYLIDLDDGVNRGFRNVKIFRNTAYGLYFGFLAKGDITNYEIRDNILADIDNTCISATEGAEEDTGSNYNLFFNCGAMVWGIGTWYNSLSDYQSATGQDMNSVEANPQFIDAANYDLTPSAGSPACTMSSTGSYVGALACS